MARIRLVSKPGCHLCDQQREVVEAIVAESGVTWEEVSILDQPELAELYWEEIPVVLVDGRKLGFWRVSADTIRAALNNGPTVASS